MSFLHDIWNPWHGCVKCSEGCQNCYMYFLDRMRDQNGAEIYKTKSGFSYPLQKDRTGHYKIQSGEQIRVCMTSDFFLEEADPWRAEAWDIMRQRSDVVFFLLTKRPQRVRECLPPDWGSGWDNIFFNVTCENQRRADERSRQNARQADLDDNRGLLRRPCGCEAQTPARNAGQRPVSQQPCSLKR